MSYWQHSLRTDVILAAQPVLASLPSTVTWYHSLDSLLLLIPLQQPAPMQENREITLLESTRCWSGKLATDTHGAVTRSRTTLKFWSATMFWTAARNFGPVHKFELPTVIADSVPRATRVFSLASVGHVTGHMVSHMVPIARCRPPYWKIFTVNNLATVF